MIAMLKYSKKLKRRYRIIIPLISLILYCCVLPLYAESIHILVRNVEKSQGIVHLGLYDQAKNFAKKRTPAMAGFYIKAVTPVTEFLLGNIAPGRYAIAVYHDLNGDKKLNQNLFGVPVERYGFSHNIFGKLGSAPRFEQASFEVKEGKVTELVIDLKEWKAAKKLAK
ncbi:DUF2141 domain-containing protein [Candidatus Haliotispira prima]|uniref:DUF2141 domain-containing protein n=1 Tax=Candidatus Haliotispira prima TaxID=3034016 RepID=A0ABY8MK52_9SPIO|nr:DUF2141 domain-containing protein [Candidatus Haliotispira prima]